MNAAEPPRRQAARPARPGRPACARGSAGPQALALALAVLLAACSSPPTRPPQGAGPRPSAPPAAIAVPPGDDRDGPGADIPPGLLQVPDAVPRLEPVRSGGPNKPYEVLGQVHAPLQGDPVLAERGLASWYGRKFHGRRTASGEVYDMYAMTAAHKTMPLPSYARVRNPANGREVVVRVNDRGPFHPGRVIDLSYTAALKLGLLRGVAPVEVQRITQAEIRSGRWRLPAEAPPAEARPGPGSVPPPDPLDSLVQRLAGPDAGRP